VSRKALFNVLKIAFAGGLLWFVITRAGLDQVKDRLAAIHLGTWLLGLTTIFLGTCISIVRWHMLMRSVGLDSQPWPAFRIGWIGVFFNNVVPGLTGGDLVKAIYITREHPRQRTDAVISVIVDRIVGIVALALIAAVVIPFDFARYRNVALGIYGFLGAAALMAVRVLSRRVKARMRGLLERFGRGSKGGGEGLLTKMDRAISMYRDRLGMLTLALGMSFVVHMLLITCIWFFADALSHGNVAAAPVPGETLEQRQHELAALGDVGLATHCSLIPIIMIISSLPIAPAGIGVGEYAFQYFYGTVGVAQSEATALSLTYRFTTIVISLFGGVLLLLDRRRVLTDVPAGSQSAP
jgi:glycosyltransferase 2 family protein